MKMKNRETVEQYAREIESAGLGRHLSEDMPELNDVHHYVVEVDYMKPEEEEVDAGIPESFEICLEDEDETTGECSAVWMFYLEEQNEEEADAILDWLKTSRKWKTYEP